MYTRQHIRKLVDHIDTFPWDYFVTLATNRQPFPGTPHARQSRADTFAASLEFWKKRLNRRLYGRNWSKQSCIYAAYAIEHVDSNIHAHMLVKVPPSEKNISFQYAVHSSWKAIFPSGTTNVQKVRPGTWATSYNYKDAHLPLVEMPFDFMGDFPSEWRQLAGRKATVTNGTDEISAPTASEDDPSEEDRQ